MRILAVPSLLLLLVACAAHKLDVRLNGLPAPSMEARVATENGRRIIDLVLPGGSWAVSATEPGIAPHIVQRDGRQHVRIELPPDRMVSSRPIVFTLQGLDGAGQPVGAPYTVSLDYNSGQQKQFRYT